MRIHIFIHIYLIKKLYDNDIRQIGIVFNLDPHYKSGSHWVCLFVNCKKQFVYYFDSYGDVTPTQIRKFARKVQDQSEKFGKRFKFSYNKKRHQFKNSECGMFSIYFLDQFIKNKHIQKTLSNKNLNDDYVFNLRKKFFTSTN